MDFEPSGVSMSIYLLFVALKKCIYILLKLVWSRLEINFASYPYLILNHNKKLNTFNHDNRKILDELMIIFFNKMIVYF